ncbi:tetratricopeptide repeat protein [Galbibacter sp.]|jgi:hypothetical protein|uniref:tetratricopeptide repeat protein n=1 Tax=Galbibacter sp. TaxID=2918471 RepID=UPI003A8FE523
MNKQDLIEQYFTGQLSNEEFLELKTLLEVDPEFKKEFHAQLEIQQTIAQEKSAFLKDRFAGLDKKSAPRTKWYLYAATVAVLIGVGIGYLFYNAQPDFQELYAQNFEAYPNVIAPTVRGDSEADMPMMEAAFHAYDSKNYTEAASLFGELYKETDQDYAYFYQNISLMAASKTETAVANLELHHWSTPQKYKTNAQWYVALGYLKLEHKEKAILYLEKVANSSTPIAHQAKEILKTLR